MEVKCGEAIVCPYGTGVDSSCKTKKFLFVIKCLNHKNTSTLTLLSMEKKYQENI